MADPGAGETVRWRHPYLGHVLAFASGNERPNSQPDYQRAAGACQIADHRCVLASLGVDQPSRSEKAVQQQPSGFGDSGQSQVPPSDRVTLVPAKLGRSLPTKRGLEHHGSIREYPRRISGSNSHRRWHGRTGATLRNLYRLDRSAYGSGRITLAAEDFAARSGWVEGFAGLPQVCRPASTMAGTGRGGIFQKGWFRFYRPANVELPPVEVRFGRRHGCPY